MDETQLAPSVDVADQCMREAGTETGDALASRSQSFGTQPTSQPQGFRAEHDGSHRISLSHVQHARALVAETYLRQGFITAEQLDALGCLCPDADPHVHDSVYFGFGRRGRLSCTGRLIHKSSVTQFPSIKEFALDPLQHEVLRCPPDRFAEVSALAKDPRHAEAEDVLHLYGAMMRHSLEQGRRYWLMAVDDRLISRLRLLFGRSNFTQLGSNYLGCSSLYHSTTPLVLDLHRSLHLLKKLTFPVRFKRIYAQEFEGMSMKHLGNAEAAILKRISRFSCDPHPVPASNQM